jgi:CRP-like cAMP-binding protein
LQKSITMDIQLALMAMVLGLVAAVSLPLGSFMTKIWKPSERVLGFMLAFGSGALLAAILDLVGERENFDWYLALGCVIGGALFVGFNKIINMHGGFLRKKSMTALYIRMKKLEQYKHIFKKLSVIPLFQSLPPEDVQAIIPFVYNRIYKKGTTIFNQGEPGDSFYIIDDGEVDIIDEKNKKNIAILKKNDVMGEMSLITGELRNATAISKSDTKIWVILKEDFDKHLLTIPDVAKAVHAIVNERITDLKEKKSIDPEVAEEWVKTAVKNFDTKTILTTDADIKAAKKEHKNAGMAIWLGNLFDCIPGAIVIGIGLTDIHAKINIALIAGLFLANFPEALSSSAEMIKQGSSFKKSFLMWTSLFLISGAFAFLGNSAFMGLGVKIFISLLEGITAGAILTMIADTMLPEAYHKYSSITGVSTLLGFLVAIFINSI